ncbi:hypothetical protein CEE36_06760 [candidate division TA06 bacterium B3_TA06]|uniref:Uncharacterized protein n=1 Tax=candidate division TA06 bacterium B3_TA06 TaxID=2012487 RepID=A0A532V6G8_UNCT6|nr:MAG: hypothetical protein CEE36_06760 [candidate division TA06 bacterium B3_TA06]
MQRVDSVIFDVIRPLDASGTHLSGIKLGFHEVAWSVGLFTLGLFFCASHRRSQEDTCRGPRGVAPFTKTFS